MSYYEQRIPPVRDQRLQLADSFSGSAGELLDCQREGCLMRKSRSFWQANACQMSLTLMMAATVAGSVIVMHAPGGCGAQLLAINVQSNKGRAQRGQPPAPLNWISTDLSEADVIGGGERKLEAAIAYADREFRPEIIFVVSTCAPNIIGDDVAEVVERAKSTAAAKIVGLHCPGFKSRVVASAYDAFYHGLLRDIPFEPEAWKDYVPLDQADPRYEMEQARENYQKAHTVNLWNATSIGYQDEDEIKRLLAALGLDTRIFAEYASLDEFRQISRAALNISMCNVHDDYMLKFLEEKYGMPYYIAGMPIGFSETRRWLGGIAARFGLEKEAARLADHEEKLAAAAIKPYLPALQGKRVLISGGVVRAGTEAAALAELGMEIIGVKAYHYDENARPIFEELAAKLPEVHVSVSNQAFELTHQIKTLKPDLVVTHNGTHGLVAKLGVPSVQLFSADGAFFGYGGFYQIMRKIHFALGNVNYQERLAGHVRQPYKDWYWSADTYTFIKE
ncbi:MAG: nitrogenase iron-molybdenum protein subunit alpha [Gracilibacteraceae bacterium]|jgi:nitrogenase molybdenum-iron protein alpha chain|nr:nitrogenase iron-molybdenum protein subunit alpha [Gracilibacteraceae bacterium]